MNKSLESKNLFESIKHIDEDGKEFWHARELMGALNYTKWQNFEKIIKKAEISCRNTNIDVKEHLTDASKMIKRGNNAEFIVKDYKLSRYICYMIAQNGDPRKKVIALAQTYFTVQTRKQEIADIEAYIMAKLLMILQKEKD